MCMLNFLKIKVINSLGHQKMKKISVQVILLFAEHSRRSRLCILSKTSQSNLSITGKHFSIFLSTTNKIDVHIVDWTSLVLWRGGG